MKDIIRKRFKDWTETIGGAAKHVRIFNGIRDISFAVVPEFFYGKESSAEMLKMNKGFCVTKHFLLGEMYGWLDIPVKYCVYSFRWEELDVSYPLELKSLAESLPYTYHLACKAFLDGRWVDIDATWDTPLAKTGFPVNERWDGTGDTEIAVKPVQEFFYDKSDEARNMLELKFKAYNLSEKLELSRFSGGLNKWLEEVRKETR